MSKKQKAKLREIFNSLEADLEIGFVACLAEKLNLSCAEIFSEYEAWQVEE
jgi:hypothetical protein